MATSINTTARIGGALYLMIIFFGLFGEMFVRDKLIVSGDVTATANNIIAHQLLWRMSMAGALLAVLFNLIQTAVLVANKLNLLMPLFLLGNSDYLKSFEPQQLYTLTYLSIRSHGYGFGLGLIYFGFECVVLGYLIIRSTYLPKLIGVLMQIAGMCYLVNSFTLILSPSTANMLFPFILIPSFIGELSLCLWLLVKGVNFSKWQEKANTVIST